MSPRVCALCGSPALPPLSSLQHRKHGLGEVRDGWNEWDCDPSRQEEVKEQVQKEETLFLAHGDSLTQGSIRCNPLMTAREGRRLQQSDLPTVPCSTVRGRGKVVARGVGGCC